MCDIIHHSSMPKTTTKLQKEKLVRYDTSSVTESGGGFFAIRWPLGGIVSHWFFLCLKNPQIRQRGWSFSREESKILFSGNPKKNIASRKPIYISTCTRRGKITTQSCSMARATESTERRILLAPENWANCGIGRKIKYENFSLLLLKNIT